MKKSVMFRKRRKSQVGIKQKIIRVKLDLVLWVRFRHRKKFKRKEYLSPLGPCYQVAGLGLPRPIRKVEEDKRGR